MITIRRRYKPEETFFDDYYFQDRKYEKEIFVKTNIYFPENIDNQLIYNLWNLKACHIGKSKCLKITLNTLALKVYEVQEITEEWEFFKGSPNFYVMEDGIDIHKILRGTPCFLLKDDFEIASNRKTVSKTK